MGLRTSLNSKPGAAHPGAPVSVRADGVRPAPQPGAVSQSARTSRPAWLGFDIPLVLVIISLIVFGILMVYSASADFSFRIFKDSTYVFLRQMRWLTSGQRRLDLLDLHGLSLAAQARHPDDGGHFAHAGLGAHRAGGTLRCRPQSVQRLNSALRAGQVGPHHLPLDLVVQPPRPDPRDSSVDSSLGSHPGSRRRVDFAPARSERRHHHCHPRIVDDLPGWWWRKTVVHRFGPGRHRRPDPRPFRPLPHRPRSPRVPISPVSKTPSSTQTTYANPWRLSFAAVGLASALACPRPSFWVCHFPTPTAFLPWLAKN